tara:strand:+ start:309 stop:587 length:279 start_codon:yes stop_codon:yes gene_type:complete
MPHSQLGHFDTYSYGFDIPASNQLGRISYKMNRWDKTQQLVEEQRELYANWQKSKVTAEKKKEENILKKNMDDEKVRKFKLDKKIEKFNEKQ